MKLVVYERDGQLLVVTPGAMKAEQLLVHLKGKGFNPKIIDKNDLPSDRVYRGSWKENLGKVEEDVEKAKEIHKNYIRFAREIVFKDLDTQFLKALENQDQIRINEIKVKKQFLRDVTNDTSLVNATDISSVRAFWPQELGEKPF